MVFENERKKKKKVKRVLKSNNLASFVKNGPRLVSPNAAPVLLYYIIYIYVCVYIFCTFPTFLTPRTTRTYILYLTGDRGPRRACPAVAEPFVNPLQVAVGGRRWRRRRRWVPSIKLQYYNVHTPSHTFTHKTHTPTHTHAHPYIARA